MRLSILARTTFPPFGRDPLQGVWVKEAHISGAGQLPDPHQTPPPLIIGTASISIRGFPPPPGEEKPAQSPRFSSRSSSRALLRANMSSRIPPQPGPPVATGDFLPHRSTPEFTAPPGSARCSVSSPPVPSPWHPASARRVVEDSIRISSSVCSVYWCLPQVPQEARCPVFMRGGIR